jgi:hypothetical protein
MPVPSLSVPFIASVLTVPLPHALLLPAALFQMYSEIENQYRKLPQQQK